MSLFEKLIFHGSHDDFDEIQLNRHMEKFLSGLGVNWPVASEAQPSMRGQSTRR